MTPARPRAVVADRPHPRRLRRTARLTRNSGPANHTPTRSVVKSSPSAIRRNFLGMARPADPPGCRAARRPVNRRAAPLGVPVEFDQVRSSAFSGSCVEQVRAHDALTLVGEGDPRRQPRTERSPDQLSTGSHPRSPGLPGRRGCGGDDDDAPASRMTARSSTIGVALGQPREQVLRQSPESRNSIIARGRRSHTLAVVLLVCPASARLQRGRGEHGSRSCWVIKGGMSTT